DFDSNAVGVELLQPSGRVGEADQAAGLVALLALPPVPGGRVEHRRRFRRRPPLPVLGQEATESVAVLRIEILAVLRRADTEVAVCRRHEKTLVLFPHMTQAYYGRRARTSAAISTARFFTRSAGTSPSTGPNSTMRSSSRPSVDASSRARSSKGSVPM